MLFTDTERPFSLTSAFGHGTLVLQKLTGHEALGRLAEWKLDLLSEKSDLDIAQMLATDLSVTVRLPEGGEREINGIVTAFERVTPASTVPNRPALWRATMRPRLWLLTRAAHCRFFYSLTVPSIVQQILTSYHIEFECRLESSYAVIEHCTQYRETDFDFVSRLLEQEGIYYFFVHENGRHRMVLADSSGAHAPIPNYASIAYWSQPAMPPEYECIHAWAHGAEVQTGIAEVNDYDFEKPVQSQQQGLLSRAQRPQHYDPALYPMQEHGIGYTNHDTADRYAQVRAQIHECANERIEGQTTVRGIWPGGLFDLRDHPCAKENTRYLVTSVDYEIEADTYLSTTSLRNTVVFNAKFAAQRHDIPFRSARLTSRPRIGGVQTAVVVCPEGEEIYTDKYGRIKVQFHWEQFAPPASEAAGSRRWVRVAHAWAGQNWGALFLPRVGQEVLVDFIEGDPDQPVVIGCVYNAAHMPPYTLPDRSARSTFKSNSTKGGNGFNEMRFDDTAGSEQLFFHAERNLDTYVKHDALCWVGNQRHLIVKADEFAECDGNRNDAVKGNVNASVGGKLSLNVSGDTQHKSGANLALTAGENIDIKGGINVTIEAGVTLTLKAGGNTIVLGPEGIAISAASMVTIDGPMVQINCGGGGGGQGAQSAEPDAPATPQHADDGSQ